MLIAVIPVHDVSEALKLINVYQSRVDGFELRWDYDTKCHLPDIQAIRASTRLPLIFTLRRQDQGGRYVHDEQQRFQDMLKLCEGHPDYVDLEWDVPKNWLITIRQRYPNLKIIGSYHHFENATFIFPDDDFDIIKVAVYCHSSLDALKLLQVQKNASKPSIFIGMGPSSTFIRPLGPIFGRLFDYASVSECNAVVEGQLSVDELLDVYRYRDINEHTRIYGLIGYPIEASLGHLYHNQAFIKNNVNAVYVKIPIKLSEVQSFFELIQSLPFDGLSVTMPLKKAVCSMVSNLDSKMQAINTLKRINDQWFGINTDGEGAIQAIGDKLSNTFILGAGGAAFAIAQALIAKGVEVVAYNRTPYDNLGFKVIHQFPEDNYGLVINTLPDDVYQDNPELLKAVLDWIKPGMAVMDVNYQKEGVFLKAIQQLDVEIIWGVEMFYAQAQLQLKYWGYDQ